MLKACRRLGDADMEASTGGNISRCGTAQALA
jgi:hypothetical protein